MWTNGRHGRPSLSIRITFSVQAWPARSLTTRSKRIRGDAPNAVALRRNVGEKPSVASGATSRSTRTLHWAYAVSGWTSEVSVLSVSPAEP